MPHHQLDSTTSLLNRLIAFPTISTDSNIDLIQFAADRLDSLGAEVHPNPLRAACCGGTLMTTKREVGLKLVADLLQAVEGADCIATVCPLCQMNLESYQGLVSKTSGQEVHIPVLYLTQLMGLAFGLPEAQLGMKHNIMPFKWMPV